MKNDPKICTFVYGEVIDATDYHQPFPVKVMMARKLASHHARQLRKRFVRLFSAAPVPADGETLNLEPGEWVEVRTGEEIAKTLDDRGKHRGLGFMPEMQKFCGKRFRVYKKVGTIMLESTGEIRRLKTPTVFLEDCFCDGQAHYGCDRSCFCFWKEAWLKRVPGKQE